MREVTSPSNVRKAAEDVVALFREMKWEEKDIISLKRHIIEVGLGIGSVSSRTLLRETLRNIPL